MFMSPGKVGELAFAALLAVSTAALASESVTLNGTTYTCQNTCVVTTYPNGGWMVKDSLNGWITKARPGTEPQ